MTWYTDIEEEIDKGFSEIKFDLDEYKDPENGWCKVEPEEMDYDREVLGRKLRKHEQGFTEILEIKIPTQLANNLRELASSNSTSLFDFIIDCLEDTVERSKI
jgi:hypothetical protein